ncbi:MAG: dihydropyrimidinase [Tenuifilaceae bacterium]|jgi:dihydropyrimidinase|nr:dihydropyrimidinase [Tenuifilaceae bacterium]
MITSVVNAHIINADRIFDADIRIENGLIAALEKPSTLTATQNNETIEAKGLYVIPGGIDPHVHLALQTPAGSSADDFVTGSAAALAGGVTHLIDFVTPRRGQALTEALKERRAEASGCSIGLDFHMGISGWLPDMEQQMEICVKEYGIKSFKVYLAYRQTIGISYEQLEKVMRIAARLNAIVLIHAEEGETIDNLRTEFIKNGNTHPRYHALSRPPETESKAVNRVIELMKKTGCTIYFVHISAAESADLISHAKQEGLPVYAETCPHYLLLDEQVYDDTIEQAMPYVYSPPARPSYHKERLWEHLQGGTFDTVATDHCPFNLNQKMVGKDNFTLIPNGAGGLEFRIPLLYSFGVLHKKLTLQQWVALTSTNAANIFGLKSKGNLAVGNKADLVLFNPNHLASLSASSQYQNCDINIYEGLTIVGSVEKTLVSGNFVHEI